MKPNFKSASFFSESLMAVEMQKIKVILKKLIYLGPTILDLSKTTMYKFHYHYMKPKYPGRI